MKRRTRDPALRLGDPWEISAGMHGFNIVNLAGATIGHVLDPATPLLDGKFQPGTQYWLILEPGQALPLTFELAHRTVAIPDETLARTDWEAHPAALFDGNSQVPYAPVQVRPRDRYYRIDVELGGQTVLAGYLFRMVGPPATTHTWHGVPGGLLPEPALPGALVIGTDTTFSFSPDPQPASGTPLHPLLDT